MKRVGILVGREQTFPESIIKSINEKSGGRSEEHTSELQSHHELVCRLLLEKKK